jgi:hypothetical protein
MSKIDFTEDILSDVLDYLNDKYNQKSVYLGGTKIPNFEEYHGVLLFYWKCGVIAVVNNRMYSIWQSDLYWIYRNWNTIDEISVKYAKSLGDTFDRIDEYFKERSKLINTDESMTIFK